MRELVEYYWNEQTEIAEFLYEHTSNTGEVSVSIESRPAPLQVDVPSLETYLSQVKRWLLDEE